MKKLTLLALALLLSFSMVACGSGDDGQNAQGPDQDIIGGADGPTTIYLSDSDPAEYTSITMGEAKAVFDQGGSYIIVDVRTPDEYSQGHIPGAINIPNESIADIEPAELPDKDQEIYVYCRSGRRSQEAASKLASLGYTHIIECGGIQDWPGDIEQ